jgi:hypothetical protein
MASHCRLTSLRTLDISPGGTAEPIRLECALQNFTASLPALESLKLSGRYTRTTLLFGIRHCGKSLRKLYPPLTSHERPLPASDASVDLAFLRQLRESCQNLDAVGFSIVRSHDDVSEVALYQMPGSFYSLSEIHLSIDRSQEFIWDYLDLHRKHKYASKVAPGYGDIGPNGFEIKRKLGLLRKLQRECPYLEAIGLCMLRS